MKMNQARVQKRLIMKNIIRAFPVNYLGMGVKLDWASGLLRKQVE